MGMLSSSAQYSPTLYSTSRFKCSSRSSGGACIRLPLPLRLLLSYSLNHTQGALLWCTFPDQSLKLETLKSILCCTSLFYRTAPLLGSWCMRMDYKNAHFNHASQSSHFEKRTIRCGNKTSVAASTYLQSNDFIDRHLEYGWYVAMCLPLFKQLLQPIYIFSPYPLSSVSPTLITIMVVIDYEVNK